MILHEGHFRFHLVIMLYVIYFGARFYALSRQQWATLVVVFSLVLGAECMNTAIERLCDRISPGYDRIIKAAKDVAAAAVLIEAIASVAVGILFFSDIATLHTAIGYYLSHIGALALLLLSAAAAVGFIVLTPRLCHTEHHPNVTQGK